MSGSGRIVELSEEEARRQVTQRGTIIADDEDYTDTSSEMTDDELDIGDETLAERVAALKEMFPPQQRRFVSQTTTNIRRWVKNVFLFGGKTTYIIATSALLMGVPLALAIVDEQQVVHMEREMKLQQGANDVLAPGATSQFSRQAV